MLSKNEPNCRSETTYTVYFEKVLQTVSSAKERLEDLPPSAKLVYKTLDYEGELTRQELAENTFLPPRTVDSALDQLRDTDLVKRDVDMQDARRYRYHLTDA